MPKPSALPATGDAIELLKAALSAGHAVTLSLTAPPRVVRPPPLITICGLLFGLTPSQARILVALEEHGYAGREDLHIAMSRDGKGASNIKTVDVVVSRVRQKLAPYGIAIITVRGAGYRLDEDDRDKLRKLIAGAATPSTDD